MSETSVIAILASVGIFLAGSVTADAAALAVAVQQGEPSALENFVYEHPDSPLAPDALWLAAEVTYDKTSDSATSSENPELTCTLNISRSEGGKATISWTITGATSASIEPLDYKKGAAIPRKGSQTISFDGYLRVHLVAKDAAGHEVKCAVVLSSSDDSVSGSTGFGGPHSYAAST